MKNVLKTKFRSLSQNDTMSFVFNQWTVQNSILSKVIKLN